METAVFDAFYLLEVQEELNRYGYTRKYCNEMVNSIRQIFKWGEAGGLSRQENLST
jgi:hypothetical protein